MGYCKDTGFRYTFGSMEWFNDQPLRPRPHIAVLFYDALAIL